jgi:hypothetical protein
MKGPGQPPRLCCDPESFPADPTSPACYSKKRAEAPWLEEMVWADVRRFLENPGEVLERVREQMESDDTSAELETRHADLTDRFDAKHKERDRWLRLYAQGHISDAELETHLADLRAQLDNLKLLLDSVSGVEHASPN